MRAACRTRDYLGYGPIRYHPSCTLERGRAPAFLCKDSPAGGFFWQVWVDYSVWLPHLLVCWACADWQDAGLTQPVEDGGVQSARQIWPATSGEPDSPTAGAKLDHILSRGTRWAYFSADSADWCRARLQPGSSAWAAQSTQRPLGRTPTLLQ